MNICYTVQRIAYYEEERGVENNNIDDFFLNFH